MFDNSHIQGTNAVGAMIVAGPEGFRKSQYRKFNIRSADLTPGRRFRHDARSLGPPLQAAPGRGADTRCRFGRGRRAAKRRTGVSVRESRETQGCSIPHLRSRGLSRNGRAEGDEDDSPWPDLVLIDGGQGQLSAARETLAALGVEVPLAAIAKGPDRDAGRETFFLPGRDSFKLPPRDPVLYFVERLRDEAHRFAVGSHRARRKRDLREAGLQEIAGIGPSRKRALLHHFGTLKAIERAAVTRPDAGRWYQRGDGAADLCVLS